MLFFNYHRAMKIILILIVALLPRLAMASSACYGLADGDSRSYCMAKAKREPGYCYSIQNPGTRAACFAEVRR